MARPARALDVQTHKKRSGTSIMVLIFMVLFFIAVSANLVLQVRQYYSLKGQEAQLAQRLADEQLQTVKLENQREYYQSDAYIEKIAREQLGLVKANEILFINRSN